MRISLLSLAVAMAFTSSPTLAQANAPATFNFARVPGRLPKNVVPIRYDIALAPNAVARTLAGHETVLLDVTAPTATIQFNSLKQRQLAGAAAGAQRRRPGAGTAADRGAATT